MTYGLFLILASVSTGLVSELHGWMQALPTRIDPAYNDAVERRASGHRFVMAAGLALPIVTHGLFKLLDPCSRPSCSRIRR